MPRIPFPDLQSISPEAREALARLPSDVAIFRMIAHADTLLKPLMRFGGAILAKTKLDPLLRELALLHAVRLAEGEYEWLQHVPVARDLGATPEQIAALERGEIAAACFDEATRDVLRFTDEMMKANRASEASLAAVRRHLDEREIVELILMAGFYTMLARLTETTGVEPDAPTGGQAIVA
jgi:alkylhydroperoxidase family enzyme